MSKKIGYVFIGIGVLIVAMFIWKVNFSISEDKGWKRHFEWVGIYYPTCKTCFDDIIQNLGINSLEECQVWGKGIFTELKAGYLICGHKCTFEKYFDRGRSYGCEKMYQYNFKFKEQKSP